MKNFVKSLNKDDSWFACLHDKFPQVYAKLKEGIFIDTWNQKTHGGEMFEKHLQTVELAA